MWECKYAQEMWKRILRLLSHANIELLVAWGSVAWASLVSEAILYESSRDSKALSIHRGVVSSLPLHPFSCQSYKEEVAVWCTKVFEGKETPLVEAIKAIWLDMRMEFHRIWRNGPFYELSTMTPKWNYLPPCYLFPPPR
ncbi:hypothetical protein KP509_29G022700 [Ceratopteris richardii]|uniref:Uncharacterized protein n=1 Tax=Ceratopteris richardii TaxID=49495 RepID=A0A8T2R6F0_CERRI|nr:hypothetical protein KP509_29G022700 [Ceratopteris richardii]